MKIMRRSLLLCLSVIVINLLSFAQNAGLPPEKVATVLGQHIRYFESGQGPVVILLHGLGAVKEVWSANLGALSAHYHVYAPDQLGFGRSDKPLLDYRIATWVDFLHAFMQSQEIAKATVIGNSLGGWIAADFAANYPEMTEKLVLVDAAGFAFHPGPLPVNLNPASLAGTRKVMESIFFNKHMVTDEMVQGVFINHMRNDDGYTIQRTLAGLLAENQFEDSKVSAVHAPTLVIWGRQDELIPLSDGEKYRDAIHGAKLVVIDQCGHVPMIEKPAEFNQAVLQFLGQ